MARPPVHDEPLDEEDETVPSLPWQIPEIVSVVALASVGVLALGGLVTGIARVVTETASIFPPGLGSQEIWNAIQLGSLWATPFIAVIILGALGLCWWQVQVWAQVVDVPEDEGDLSDALGRVRRASLIARWAMVVLALTAAGAMAGFVADVGLNASGPSWPIDVDEGASLFAVLLLLSAAVLVGRQVLVRNGLSILGVEESTDATTR